MTSRGFFAGVIRDSRPRERGVAMEAADAIAVDAITADTPDDATLEASAPVVAQRDSARTQRPASKVVAAAPAVAQRKTIDRDVSVPMQRAELSTPIAPASDEVEAASRVLRAAAERPAMPAKTVKMRSSAGDEQVARVAAPTAAAHRARSLPNAVVPVAHAAAHSPRTAASSMTPVARAIDVTQMHTASAQPPAPPVNVRTAEVQSGAPVVVPESRPIEAVTSVPHESSTTHVVVEASPADHGAMPAAERHVVTSTRIVPSERERGRATATPPPSRNESVRSEPRVHIGVVEIVVTAPEEARPVAAAPAPTSNLASRRYLRSL